MKRVPLAVPPARSIIHRAGIKLADGNLARKFPHQLEFERGQWTHRHNCAAGGLFSLKTSENLDIAGNEALKHSGRGLTYKPLRILFAARTDDTALETLVEPFIDMFGREIEDPETGETLVKLVQAMNQQQKFLLFGKDCSREWDAQGKRWIFPVNKCHPARIEWTGLDPSKNQPHNLRYSGRPTYDLIIVTQLDLLTKDAYDACDHRLGRRDIPGFLPRILSDQNVNFHWASETFVPKGEARRDKKYFTVLSTTYDNPSAPQDYLDSLESQPRAIADMLTGRSWMGQSKDRIFDKFSAKNRLRWDHNAEGQNPNAVCEIPFKLSWSFYKGYDYGFIKDPAFIVWIATDHDGNAYALEELELYRLSEPEQAEAIWAKEYALCAEIGRIIGCKAEEVMARFQGHFAPFDLEATNEYAKKTRRDLFREDPVTGKLLPHPIRWTIVPRTGGKLTDGNNRVSIVTAMCGSKPGHKHPATREDNAPTLYVADRCVRVLWQIGMAVVNPKARDEMWDGKLPNPHAEDKTDTMHFDAIAALGHGIQGIHGYHEPPIKKQLKDMTLADRMNAIIEHDRRRR